MSLTRTLGAFLLAAALGGCSTTYDGGTANEPMVMVDPGHATVESPYTVEILGDGGTPMQTYDAGGKFYVLGEAGSRYQIHIVNPTALRVEAVVTVDGLDVVDGEDGDLRKRGYVVPPGGDLRIEGFRTSSSEVATFRFSSVGESYAGRKGKARNVGVIAVALFAETAPVEIIAPDVIAGEPTYTYEEDKKDSGSSAGSGSSAPSHRSGGGGASKGAPRGYDDSLEGADGDSVGGAPARMRPPPPPDDEVGDAEAPYQPDPCCQKSTRPGLGTEYGEQRYSAATWTKFVRASETPTAIAELRYNDAGGLAALGILIGPATATPDEITTRETADPFPGDPAFARPPAGIR